MGIAETCKSFKQPRAVSVIPNTATANQIRTLRDVAPKVRMNALLVRSSSRE
jgi:hypothetical protein